MAISKRGCTVAIVALSALFLLGGGSREAAAQFAQQGSKLVGTGGSGAGDQGYSVALSADGNTAVIGAPNANSQAGAAWIFVRSGGVWTQQGSKLVGTGAVGAAYQGASVALSGDGNTAMIGGWMDNSGAGAAWIFRRSGGVWTQQGSKLVGSGAVGAANQGSSVALSADGNTAIIGGPNDNSSAGATWAFTSGGGLEWTQQGSKLVGSGAVNPASQGAAVALSADGNTVIIGGINDNANVGAAWIFAKAGGVWLQQGEKLVGTGASGPGQQGLSVALSSDGNTAIESADYDNSGIGAIWVFIRSDSGWTQQGSKLFGSGGVGQPQQGFSVGLSGDGNTAIAGGPGDNSSKGAAWVFTRSGATWTQQGSKLVGSGAVGSQTGQGFSVALSSDGTTALVGGIRDNSLTGATWVFVAPNFNPAASHDFNGDGVSDILWKDASGDLAMWLMNGGQMSSGAIFGNVGTSWSVAGQRDFNGDGDADILWRDNAGDLALWLMNGFTPSTYKNFGNVTTDWIVVGTGDLDGDGMGDILWQNANGLLAIWFMNGTTISSAVDVGTVPTNWSVVGDDNHGVIFWRDTTGDLALWQVKGTQIVQSAALGNVPTNWVIAGLGDFNGDGITDILWRDNNSGDVAIWLMNQNLTIQSAVTVGTVATNWSITQTGDYNGDGMSDILWLDTSGNVAVWLMNGTALSSGISLGNVGTNWQVQGQNAD